MSADYINIQSEKDKLADDNARLMDQLKKMRHRNGFGYRKTRTVRVGLSECSVRVLIMEKCENLKK